MSKLREVDSVSALLLGTNGTGKSTFLRNILDKAVHDKSKFGRVLVIPSNIDEPTFQDIPAIKINQINSFKGAAKIMCYEPEHFKQVAIKYKVGVLMSDDFRNYITQYQMLPEVRQMFINRRHRKIDIYMACHGFTQSVPEMYNFLNAIVLFRTTDSIKRRKDSVPRYELMEKLVNEVNQKARENPYYHKIIEV